MVNREGGDLELRALGPGDLARLLAVYAAASSGVRLLVGVSL